MPLFTLDSVSVAFGHLPLLDRVAFQIDRGERVAVIGRNGTGKSTLLRIVNGDLQPDAGTAWRQPALKTARLDQDVPLNADRPVFDVGAIRYVRVLKRTGVGPGGGRALTVEAAGSRGKRVLTADQVRIRLHLRSAWISFPARTS